MRNGLASYKLCMQPILMAEKTSTVNISFREDLLNEIDEVARAESRSRSELLREAARLTSVNYNSRPTTIIFPGFVLGSLRLSQ
jgi:hypothetical protein